MYDANQNRRGTKLKRCSTLHVSEGTAIASEFGNSAKFIVPFDWLRKRVIAFFYLDLSQHREEQDE
jgi:hypothetical protein